MTADAVLLVLTGTCAAGFVSGLSGFAFGMVGISFWIWAIDPQALAPMVVFGSLVAQLLSIAAVRRSLSWRRLLPFLLGGAAGVPIGVLLLQTINIAVFRGVIGVVLIAYCSYMLWNSQGHQFARGGRLADGAVGVLGGVMGGLAGLSGPAPTLWCSLRGWPKDVQRSVFQSFNLAMHAMTLTAYAINGTITPDIAGTFALMLPAILLPTWAGVRLYRRIDEGRFRRLILSLLLLSGLVLLLSAALR